MNNQELDIETQWLRDDGAWQAFGIRDIVLNHRPITILPNRRHVALQGTVYWVQEWIDGLNDEEVESLFGMA